MVDPVSRTKSASRRIPVRSTTSYHGFKMQIMRSGRAVDRSGFYRNGDITCTFKGSTDIPTYKLRVIPGVQNNSGRRKIDAHFGVLCLARQRFGGGWNTATSSAPSVSPLSDLGSSTHVRHHFTTKV